MNVFVIPTSNEEGSHAIKEKGKENNIKINTVKLNAEDMGDTKTRENFVISVVKVKIG